VVQVFRQFGLRCTNANYATLGERQDTHAAAAAQDRRRQCGRAGIQQEAIKLQLASLLSVNICCCAPDRVVWTP